MPPKGTFEGKHRRGRLTAMRQMPVITGPPSRAHAAQAKRHCTIATLTQNKPRAHPGGRHGIAALTLDVTRYNPFCRK
jgi:hypothetical protein